MNTSNIKYKKIIDIIEDESTIFDFFSVLFWYRDIWLFYISKDFDINQNKIKNNEILININNLVNNNFFSIYPEYIKSINIINNFLNENYKNYIFKYWFNGLFFIYKNNTRTEEKIIKLLKKYKNPIDINILEWWRDLWLVLNFPKCCVAQFYKEKIKSEFTTKLILDRKFINIPFAPCKMECWEKWLKYYYEIKKKLK